MLDESVGGPVGGDVSPMLCFMGLEAAARFTYVDAVAATTGYFVDFTEWQGVGWPTDRNTLSLIWNQNIRLE